MSETQKNNPLHGKTLQVILTYLVDYYGNWVDDLGDHGVYDPITKTITIKYSICYPAGDSNCRYYDMVYTKI